MRAAAGIGTGRDWRTALEGALKQIDLPADNASVDLALLFASSEYAPEYPQLLAEARRVLGSGVLIGCSGQGVIGGVEEIEQEPAVSLLAFSLPGADLRPFHVSQADIHDDESAASWLGDLRQDGPDVNAWMLLADPFSLDADRLLTTLDAAYPGKPLVGGLASGNPMRQQTHLFLNDEVLEDGAVALAISGPYTVHTVVSQGAQPIGETWTVTGAHGNIVDTLGMRPALDILVETFRALPPPVQERARSNLLVGLAMNEYQDEFHRGDFLIRNLLGIDQEKGVIAIGAVPRVGQTLQFQLRDPEAADEDLTALLGQARQELGDQQVIGGLLCACNGRGIGLFGAPGHDARAINNQLGPIPLAGFFCNGEIGPIGGKPFLHGFTASLALIVPHPPA
jgi:small ligand-binding sensory domain FIST